MKRYLFLLIVTILSSPMFADTHIKMEEYNGVYRIPCTINGAKMKFIFDTGASNVCISLSMAEYLLDNDFINDTDILGTGTSTVADGRIIDHVIINLRDIEIAGNHLRNVRAVVTESQNAPLLMGQSALKQLGAYTIQGNTLVLHNDDYLSNQTSSFEERELDELFNNAYEAYLNEDYREASLIYNKLYNDNRLSPYGKYLYAACLTFDGNYYDSIEILNEIEPYFGNEEPDLEYRLYELLGRSYREIGNFDKAKTCFNKASRKVPISLKWRGEDVRIVFLHSRVYVATNDYFRAQRIMTDYIKSYLSYFDIRTTDCWDKKYQDKTLGRQYYYLALCYDLKQSGASKDWDKYMILSAAWGYPDAIENCKEYKLEYVKKPYEYEY